MANATLAEVEKDSSVSEQEKTEEWQTRISRALSHARCTTRRELVRFLLNRVNELRAEIGYDLG